MPLLLAFERTELTVRPSFRPITRVGVFSRANSLSCFTSAGVQSFPVFRVYFDISGSPYFILLPIQHDPNHSNPFRQGVGPGLNYRTPSALSCRPLKQADSLWFAGPGVGAARLV